MARVKMGKDIRNEGDLQNLVTGIIFRTDGEFTIEEILPVINKIDLPNARSEDVKREIEDIIGIPAMDAPCISAKSGLNIDEVLERIVTEFKAPTGDINDSLKCLIFDSFYDNYKGAVSYVRVKTGFVKVGDEILVKSLGFDKKGRLNLSRKEAMK